MSFKSWRSYWDFSLHVKSKQRYILDEKSKSFLGSIIDTCQDRTNTISRDSIIWRAQDGHSLRPYYQSDPETGEEIHVEDLPVPYPWERMKPLVGTASEGRVNPKGIPCLYAATDKETAMSEVRPWLDSIISVGQFRLNRDIKIIDFSVLHGEKPSLSMYLNNKHSLEQIVTAVWLDIDNAFSKPTKASDMKSDYAPTQIISEYIKSKGYDGIVYKSSLADGHNIALFDLEAASVSGCSIYKTSEINFNFEYVPDDY